MTGKNLEELRAAARYRYHLEQHLHWDDVVHRQRSRITKGQYAEWLWHQMLMEILEQALGVDVANRIADEVKNQRVSGQHHTCEQRQIPDGPTITLNGSYHRWLASDDKRAWLTNATREELLEVLWHTEAEMIQLAGEKDLADYMVGLAGYVHADVEELRDLALSRSE